MIPHSFSKAIRFFGSFVAVLLLGMVLGVLLVDVGYVPSSTRLAEHTLVSSERIEVSVTIDYGNDDEQSFLGVRLDAGASVYDALIALENERGVILEERNFPGLGKFIEAINGVHNTNTMYWQFWVNGEYSQVAAEMYQLDDRDDILWKRTNEKPTNF